jgi:Ni/Co efflux regulator RcnB
MRKTQLIGALMVAVLGLLQAPAMADSGKGDNGRHGNSKRCGNGQQDCGRDSYRGRDNHGRGEQGSQRSDHARGAGPTHSYYPGDRLPYDHRGRQYVVEDWHGHGLRSPPRGYHWVQSGGDYVLVAIATGVILELLLYR